MYDEVPFSVITWNCLADTYSRGPIAQKESDVDVVSWSFRSKLIHEVVSHHDADIVCLQEVDHYEDHFKPFFFARSYHVEYVQRVGRQDGILIAFKRHKFVLLQKQIVHFDDLSRVQPHILQPLTKSSLRRQNVALILLLRVAVAEFADSKVNTIQNRAFTVCTTHLYWNPHYPNVKLAQTRYLMERLVDVRLEPHWLPPCASLLTGDFNSEPASSQHAVVRNGRPFLPTTDRRSTSTAARIAVSQMTSRHRFNLSNDSILDNDLSVGETRFLCDATLSKLVRWLRLLGVDAALEDKASQERRAVFNDFAPLFNRARCERRVLVTTSTSMQKRNTCPETFLVPTSMANSELKRSLASLLNRYEVCLKKANFFSICGKCGGTVVTTKNNDERLDGRFAPNDRQIYICQGCHQVYWCSDSSEGCSSRARRLANGLFTYVEASKRKRGNKEKEKEKDKADFEADVKALRRYTVEGCRQQWLRYQSAYSQVHGREPEYTNINGPYQGTLDYIFVGGAVKAESASTQCSLTKMQTNKLFPNVNWPSDHMLVRADVVLRVRRAGRPWFARTLSDI